jgi:hypothetical protein
VREPVERPLILCEKASSAHAAVGVDPWQPQLQAEAIQPLSIGTENVSVSDKRVIRPLDLVLVNTGTTTRDRSDESPPSSD